MPVLKTALAAAAILTSGHVDIGPRIVDDRLSLQVFDDPTWRAPQDTVLHVRDEAIQRVPEDPAYAFLPRGDVFVIPQTQDPDVVWLGWNTQHETVRERVDRGVTMTLAGVQGPGELVVYLQSGDFAEPDVLSTDPIWIDVNTHTHANWVFSQPGVYLVRVKLEADLKDGRAVSDTRELRFAVGSKTSPEAAHAATWRTARRAAPPPPQSTTVPVGPLIVAVAVVLLGAAVIVVARGRGAKRRARA
ncbi:choice-of-anchor M domain-containing protein [Solirubrobacter taibaiensis]|nr:choice-of-anchor M domain-containing protein [Solirubrobacter taibaiensis]